MKTIGIVTTSRADFGLYRPVIKELEKRKGIDYFLIVSGSHMSPRHGMTIREIECEGFKILEKGSIFTRSDSPEATVKAMGKALGFYAGAIARRNPDILMVLGDRIEMFCAALAALPFNIPVAHIHGGEITEGAIDDSLRHAMTKLSHIHFTATEEYRNRVIQLGEDPDRVFVSGAPSLDNLKNEKLLSMRDLASETGIDPSEPFILATLHPETAGNVSNRKMALEFFGALEDCGMKAVITMPNADTGGNEIRSVIREKSSANPAFALFENLGTRLYFSMMKYARVMAGNSSSGIIEAASFELPVVNVGDRQKGRTRSLNVIDTPCKRRAIVESIRKACSTSFQNNLKNMKNPYGEGEAARIIVTVISSSGIDSSWCRKKFFHAGPRRVGK